MKNLLKVINEEYNDICMGVIIYFYLVGYNDVCVVVYFVKNNGFKVVCCGIVKFGDVYNGFICLNVYEDDFFYWMKVFEVCFLKVEGVLVGFDMGGSVGDFYNVGICMLFSENGLDNLLVEIYLKDFICKLVNYIDIFNGELSVNVLSSIIICWENGVMEEEKLECIII